MGKKNEMTCPVCGGKAELAEEDVPLLNGRVTMKRVKGFRCGKCRETFSTSEQMRQATKQLKKAFFFYPYLSFFCFLLRDWRGFKSKDLFMEAFSG